MVNHRPIINDEEDSYGPVNEDFYEYIDVQEDEDVIPNEEQVKNNVDFNKIPDISITDVTEDDDTTVKRITFSVIFLITICKVEPYNLIMSSTYQGLMSIRA
ncbi:hypothetical protein LXL04_008536 [Taraxacum kok-saghyz]